MNTKEIPMSQGVVVPSVWTLLLAGASLLSGLGVLPAFGEPDKAAGTTSKTCSIKGTLKFGGTQSTWSATLTPKGKGTYQAAYIALWGGKPLNYVGTIETDGRTKIKGTGKASGGGANGTFEFSGTYGNDGVARCSYREVGGARSGSMTAEAPKPGTAKASSTAPSAPAGGAASGAHPR
jgi:hypothetical protein